MFLNFFYLLCTDHGKEHIWLSPSNFEPDIMKSHFGIEVFGLRFCLPFLRCFGSKISNLQVNSFDLASEHFDQYINEHCADTLASIEFSNKIGTLSFSRKPFKNVTSIEINEGDVRDQLPNFMNWFPNLKRMDIFGNFEFGESTASVTFPHLKELGIRVRVNGSGHSKSEMVTKLLHANQQLQDLDVDFGFGMVTLDKILDMIILNTPITKFVAYGPEFANEAELKRFTMEHPMVEELNFRYTQISPDDAIFFIRQMISLERFTFKVKDQTECDRLLNRLDSKWQHEIYNDDYDDQSKHIEISR